MENHDLDLIIKEYTEGQLGELNKLENSISQSVADPNQFISTDLLTPELQRKIDHEVQLQIMEFQKSIDLKPKALYHALKVETELNPEINEKDLKKTAYEFLEKNTKNKYIKKIIRELKKGV